MHIIIIPIFTIPYPKLNDGNIRKGHYMPFPYFFVDSINLSIQIIIGAGTPRIILKKNEAI